VDLVEASMEICSFDQMKMGPADGGIPRVDQTVVSPRLWLPDGLPWAHRISSKPRPENSYGARRVFDDLIRAPAGEPRIMRRRMDGFRN